MVKRKLLLVSMVTLVSVVYAEQASCRANRHFPRPLSAVFESFNRVNKSVTPAVVTACQHVGQSIKTAIPYVIASHERVGNSILRKVREIRERKDSLSGLISEDQTREKISRIFSAIGNGTHKLYDGAYTFGKVTGSLVASSASLLGSLCKSAGVLVKNVAEPIGSLITDDIPSVCSGVSEVFVSGVTPLLDDGAEVATSVSNFSNALFAKKKK